MIEYYNKYRWKDSFYLTSGKDRGDRLKSHRFTLKEKKMITVDSAGRVLVEAVSISPKRRKETALQTWSRVEYKNNAKYAWFQLKSGRMPQNV